VFDATETGPLSRIAAENAMSFDETAAYWVTLGPAAWRTSSDH
jgi:hypothetical protein